MISMPWLPEFLAASGVDVKDLDPEMQAILTQHQVKQFAHK